MRCGNRLWIWQKQLNHDANEVLGGESQAEQEAETVTHSINQENAMDLSNSLLATYRRNSKSYASCKRSVSPDLLPPHRWDCFRFERPLPAGGGSVDWTDTHQHIADTKAAGFIEFGVYDYSIGPSFKHEALAEEFGNAWEADHPDSTFDEPGIEEAWEQFWYSQYSEPAPAWDGPCNRVVTMQVYFRPKRKL